MSISLQFGDVVDVLLLQRALEAVQGSINCSVGFGLHTELIEQEPLYRVAY
jgi:hypothetical protein